MGGEGGVLPMGGEGGVLPMGGGGGVLQEEAPPQPLMIYTREEILTGKRNGVTVSQKDMLPHARAMRSGDNGRFPVGGRQDKATLTRNMIAWMDDPSKTAGVELTSTPADPPPW